MEKKGMSSLETPIRRRTFPCSSTTSNSSTSVTTFDSLGTPHQVDVYFVKTAAGFRSQVLMQNLTRGTAPGDAKSILTVLAAGVAKGHFIRLWIDGEDEEAAAQALSELVVSGFGEAVE